VVRSSIDEGVDNTCVCGFVSERKDGTGAPEMSVVKLPAATIWRGGGG